MEAETEEEEEEGAMAAAGEGRVGEKLAPFNPSSVAVIETALEMLNLGPEDVLFDLGCGDGRVLVEACRRTRAKGVGVDYDPELVKKARRAVEDAGVENWVQVRHESLADTDTREATAAFVYLVPDGLKVAAEKLRQIVEQGGRVVSYVFSIPGMAPTRIEYYKSTKISLYAQDGL